MRTIWGMARERTFRNPFAFSVLAMTLLVACHTRSGDEGSVRVKREQVIGMYATTIADGWERLELKRDGTFIQEFASKSDAYRRTGHWRLKNEFLDGSAVVLADAVTWNHHIADETPTNRSGGGKDEVQRSIGELTLYTHDSQGNIVLVLNEVADWYYERLH
jgi:hypothetical protein